MPLVPSSGGVRIALHDLGGDGPPLLAVHATGFCGRIWEPVAAELTRFRWWAPDTRGHGDSAVPDEADLSWHGVADDVLAVVDHLGLVGGVAVGHSMGGAALLLAELARPGTFGALWCYEPVTPPAELSARRPESDLVAASLRRRDRFPSRDAAYENFASKPPFDVCAPAALRAYVDHAFVESGAGDEVRLKCRPHCESTLYRMGALHGAFERLAEIRCPVTVVTGEPEPNRPSTYAAEVVDRLAQGRLEHLDGLGHFGPQQDPRRVARSIDTALRGT